LLYTPNCTPELQPLRKFDSRLSRYSSLWFTMFALKLEVICVKSLLQKQMPIYFFNPETVSRMAP